jgi:nitrate reductase NapA
VFEKAVDPPGEAKWDGWIFMQVAQRVLDGEMIGDTDAMDKLFGFVWDKSTGDFKMDSRETNKAIFEEYRIFTNPSMLPAAQAIANNDNNVEGWGKLKMENKQLAPYDQYLDKHGICWPVREVDGEWLETKWRWANGDQKEGFDQIGDEMYGVADNTDGITFYKAANNKASAVFRPYEPPAEMPDDEYPFWFCTGRLLEQWHTGSMTDRIPELNKALPEALLDMNAEDAERLGLANGDKARVTSRHGTFDITVSLAGRTKPPVGMCFAAFFKPETLINLAVQDYYCPLSKEPDFKKTCVKIEKI